MFSDLNEKLFEKVGETQDTVQALRSGFSVFSVRSGSAKTLVQLADVKEQLKTVTAKQDMTMSVLETIHRTLSNVIRSAGLFGHPQREEAMLTFYCIELVITGELANTV